MSTDTRLEAFRTLLGSYGATPDDYDEDVEEDVRPYLEGKRSPLRFALVTTNAEKPYFLLLETLAAAQERGLDYITDSIFSETPREVVDLDTGAHHYPRWSTVEWYEVA